jgi:quercetin dioxygenase-like cupin family protein
MAVILLSTQLPSAADHMPIHGETLARTAFSDPLDVKIKTRSAGHTQVVHTREPSDMVMMRITVQPGARFPWHVHNGPVMVAVVEGSLAYIDAEVCDDRVYTAGSAFLDAGNHVHSAYNPGSTPTVLYATFLGVEGAPTIPVPGPDRSHCET